MQKFDAYHRLTIVRPIVIIRNVPVHVKFVNPLRDQWKSSVYAVLSREKTYLVTNFLKRSISISFEIKEGRSTSEERYTSLSLTTR